MRRSDYAGGLISRVKAARRPGTVPGKLVVVLAAAADDNVSDGPSELDVCLGRIRPLPGARSLSDEVRAHGGSGWL
jgi:hypothetical protein